MIVKFNDLSTVNQKISNSILKTIKKNKFILSNEVSMFEKEFSNFCNAKYTVGCANGYDALFLSLKVLDLDKNSEVIVPAMTYAATAYAVINSGLKLKLVDVDKNGLLDLNKLEKKINKKTKAIIPVHLYGQPVNMKKLINIKKKYNLKIIEDCAQAHGAYDYTTKKKIGCIGDIACYSFYPGKNLGAIGDAGAIVTNNKNYYNKLKGFRALGSKVKYVHNTFGVNSRLDEIQACALRSKLKFLNIHNNSRKKIAKYYNENIKSHKYLEFINTTKGSVFHVFNIIVKDRKHLMNYLKKKHIDCVIHYPKSINQHNFLKNISNEKFYFAEKLAKKSLSIPIYPFMKKKQIDHVVKNINKYFTTRAYDY